MSESVKMTIVWLVAGLAFTALLVFGIGWATNLGDPDTAKIVASCAAHPGAPICNEQSQSDLIDRCEDLADNASTTAGDSDQTFTAENWQRDFDDCMGRK